MAQVIDPPVATISTENFVYVEGQVRTLPYDTDVFRHNGYIKPLHKRVSCTCGWRSMFAVMRSEQAAKHHILFTHGEGEVMFNGHLINIKDKD